MASNPHRDPIDIVDRYDRHPSWNEYPVVPRDEQDDWLPFRPICKKAGYDLPAAINEGWTVRVYDWRFKQLLEEHGQASPERFMIHKDWLRDFLIAAGVEPDEDTLLDIGIRYHESIERINNAFDEAIDAAQRAFNAAIDAAQRVRIEAQDHAEDEFLDALSEYERRQ